MGFVKERLRKQLAPILAPENTNPCKLDAYRDFRREEGIRTLDTLLEYTHFPGVRLRPLGHLSNCGCKNITYVWFSQINLTFLLLNFLRTMY